MDDYKFRFQKYQTSDELVRALIGKSQICKTHLFNIEADYFGGKNFCLVCEALDRNNTLRIEQIEMITKLEYHSRTTCDNCHFGLEDDYSVVCRYNPKTIRKGKCDICNFFKRKDKE